MNGNNFDYKIGYLTKDPKIQLSKNGSPYVSGVIAVHKRWKDKNTGKTMEKTTFVPFRAFGEKAVILRKYITTKDKVLLMGELDTNPWDDERGSHHYGLYLRVDDIEFLSNKRQEAATPQQVVDNLANTNLSPDVVALLQADASGQQNVPAQTVQTPAQKTEAPLINTGSYDAKAAQASFINI